MTVETSQGPLFSDHNVIQFTLHTVGKLNKAKQILYRKSKGIDISTLKERIESIITSQQQCKGTSTDNLTTLCKLSLKNVMDEIEPLKTKTILDEPKLPWFNDTLSAEIRTRRRLENIWKKDINNAN